MIWVGECDRDRIGDDLFNGYDRDCTASVLVDDCNRRVLGEG